MYGPICTKCESKLSRIELDPTHFYYWCPDCDISYSEDQVTYGDYHLDEVSRELKRGDTLLVRLEGGELYVGITRTDHGYGIDTHNGRYLLTDPDGNDLTMTVWEDDWRSIDHLRRNPIIDDAVDDIIDQLEEQLSYLRGIWGDRYNELAPKFVVAAVRSGLAVCCQLNAIEEYGDIQIRQLLSDTKSVEWCADAKTSISIVQETVTGYVGQILDKVADANTRELGQIFRYIIREFI